MNAKKSKAIRKYANNKDDGLTAEEKEKLYKHMKITYTKANIILKSKHK